MNERQLVTVTEFCTVIKRIFQAEEMLKNIAIVGEISGFRASGAHSYFSLKDSGAILPCSCFNYKKTYMPKEGEKVIVVGFPDYYVQGGRFSFIVSQIEPQGIGLLYQKIEELKKKLADEGIFDAAHKKPIPKFPKNVIVVTSKSGAVIRDICRTIRKYNDNIDIVVKDVKVQGEFATMNGWEAESDAANLLNGLGIETDLHYKQMADLTGAQKVKVLLAQALFGNPDILLLDEPTNHLDLDAIAWLEEFLINFENTVIVVSHDRYFLNKVCTQIADIDYGKIQLYAGNYDFWYESSQLMIKQMKEANKKKEEKIKELQEFIQRFSANASKSKQATSRKRALEKIELDEIKPSSRKYPYIDFRPEREIGNEVLSVENLSKTIDGVKVLDNISFILGREDKVAFVGPNEQAKTVLFKIISGEMEPDEGSYKWGLTTSQAYFPKDNSKEFDNDDTIVDWLTQYSPVKDVTYVRGFLGRMLFAGEDGVKKVRVLSGGEKVRCMLSKMMISGSNVLILDEPTDHLDMESITALNNGMIKFPGVLLFSSRDHQIVETTANRIMEIVNGKLIDKITTYDEYLANDEMARKRQVFTVTDSEEEDD